MDKLECLFPTLFKVMWLSTVVWMVIGIANCFGNWLIPGKLDEVGITILLIFTVSIVLGFRKGLLKLINQYGLLKVGSWSKKVTSYSFMFSFVIMFILSIWNLCGATSEESVFVRNGSIGSIPEETVFTIVGDIFKAAVVSIVSFVIYWYVKICFIMFTGRIRRLGIEIGVALIMRVYLTKNISDNIWINATVVIIAAFFLYDIWHFAAFKETNFSWTLIESVVKDDDEND